VPVLKRVAHGDGRPYGYRFECPGCGKPHVVPVKPTTQGWDFDGNEAAPTFSPSILVYEYRIPKDADPAKILPPFKPGDVYQPRCHSFVKRGRIEFLGDCGHALAGKTVPLPEIPSYPRG
jgi:hypothetical protein